MIKPEVSETLSINCSIDFFHKKIYEIFSNLGGKGFYKINKLSPFSIKITSNRFLYRKINLSEVEINLKKDNQKLIVNYRVNFQKWFIALLFMSFTLIIAFGIFYFFFSNKYHPQLLPSHYVIIWGSIFFWAFIWPLIMTMFYKGMVKNFMLKILGLIEAQYLILKNGENQDK